MINAQMQMLFATAKQFHPALLGDRKQPQENTITVEQNNRQALRLLYQYWQQQHPEAGRAYWSVRCWTLIIWQPIYLLLAAIHGCHLLPDLRTMSQHINQGSVSGFSLTGMNLQTGDQSILINKASKQLNSLCQNLLVQCQDVFHLRSHLAIRLAADIVLSALINLPSIHASVNTNEIFRLADTWLRALAWQQQSELMSIELGNGQQHLALKRKSCCFDYCRSGGDICATCPKQSLDKRRQRIIQEHCGIALR